MTRRRWPMTRVIACAICGGRLGHNECTCPRDEHKLGRFRLVDVDQPIAYADTGKKLQREGDT